MKTFATCGDNNEASNKVYRFYMAYTEGKITSNVKRHILCT